MREISQEELKQIQLNILIRLHEFCVKNEINYSISSGTLIGAVRHKGYIPWDDDIDTYMLRSDYERLLKEFEDEYLRVISPDTSKDCIYPYAKVYDSRTLLIEDVDFRMADLGVNIDVFIIDSVPDELPARKRLFRLNTILDNAIMIKLVKYRKGRSLIKNLGLMIGKIILKLVPLRWLIKKKFYLPGMFNPNAKEICNVMAGGGIKACIPMDVMQSFIDIDFEGHTFKCMKEFDFYLRLNYGDYMQLPPEEKRVTHHDFKAYWKYKNICTK